MSRAVRKRGSVYDGAQASCIYITTCSKSQEPQEWAPQMPLSGLGLGGYVRES